jgi:glutamine amidotransferase
MVTIVDYGMGNLGSVINMLKKIGVRSIVTSKSEEILSAEKILLPGVGAFDAAVKRIDEMNLRSVLTRKALVDKVPFLGICLGMQLLTRSSEEGVLKGLDFVPAKTIKFRLDSFNDLKIPHMGWNFVKENRPSDLTRDFTSDFRFYFVHSYYVMCDDDSNCILKTTHGVQFHSAIQNGNVYGTQFHPEKSHKYGMQLLKNFSNL